MELIKRKIDCGEIYIPTMVEERLLRVGIKLTYQKVKVIYKKNGTIILKPIKTT